MGSTADRERERQRVRNDRVSFQNVDRQWYIRIVCCLCWNETALSCKVGPWKMLSCFVAGDSLHLPSMLRDFTR